MDSNITPRQLHKIKKFIINMLKAEQQDPSYSTESDDSDTDEDTDDLIKETFKVVKTDDGFYKII